MTEGKSFIAALDNVLLRITNAGLLISVVVLAVIGIPVVLDVFGRVLFSVSILGVSDLSEVLMAVMAFAIMAYVQARDQHISVDLIRGRLSDGKRALLDFYNWGVCLGMTLVLAWAIFQGARELMRVGQTTPVLNIIIWPVHMFSALCILLLACAFLRSMLQAVAERRRAGSLRMLVIPLAFALLTAALPLLPDYLGWNLSRTGAGFLCFGMMFLLIFLGMPLGMGMTLMGTLGLFMIMPRTGPVISLLGSAPYHAVASVLFMVVPMFLLMGEFALYTNLSKDMFHALSLWMGRTPGGLAAAAVGGCAGFAAICGDSLATAATMASVAVPEMRAKGYNAAYGCAAVASGGTLGILIPPSVGFIIYSIITEQSVGTLFVAGIIPGVLLTLIIMATFIIMAMRNPALAPSSHAVPMMDKLKGTVRLLPMLLMILLILGGILMGAFSPTEGGAMGAFFTLMYGFVRRIITWKNIKRSLVNTAIINGRLMLVLMGVGIFGYFMAATRLPNNLANILVGMGATPYAVLFGVIVLYIVLGCLMNVIPMMMLTMPALFPTVIGMGFDPIWFGVLSVVLMELGQITPPVGIIVFAMASIVKDVPVEAIFAKVMPVFLGIFLLLLLLILFPQLALWLPGLMA